MNIPNDYLNIYTTENQARQINTVILKYTQNNITITDATAGIGGNSIQFCKCFKHVICIENNYDTFNVLKQNLKNFQNNKLYTCSFNAVKYITKQDVIFIDPPWGGNDYKLKKRINLYLDNLDVIDIINSL
jgi:16S rRNA G966 N2-methylase RsmD